MSPREPQGLRPSRQLALSVASCVIQLSSNAEQAGVPLLELELKDLASSVASNASVALEARSQASVAFSAYSMARLGWEPAIEPWRFALDVHLARPGCGPNSSSLRQCC